MENVTLVILVSISSLIGSFIGNYIKSYSTEKAKNLATREDIEEITNKIENIKNSYSIALETNRNELKKMYDISKPALELSTELDKTLIEKVHSLNNLLFEYKSFGGSEKADQILNQLADLSKYIVAYRNRYKDISGVKEIIDVNNSIAKMRIENKIDEVKITADINKLSDNLEILLNFFLVPLTNKH